ncbi:urease accessory protein UreF [Roseovarius sp.]|uniref:urease accessory protein UreF n=1 Tax=Roseovarius sp. TaxID=1486281 RepID=UPI0025EB088F|nr:urease accessory UreF family protein [Roseovarius sp.]
MTTDLQVLTLAQWLSPAYPTGAFAYSHGIEMAVQEGSVTTAAGLQGWLADVLAHGSGRNDCVLLRAAHACDSVDEVLAVDAAAQAFAGAAERLRETRLQGHAFAKTTAHIRGDDLPDLCAPVAVGYAAGRAALPVNLTAAMYLQAFVGNLVSAAVRLVPLGQTEGQAVLAALTPLCHEIAEETADTPLDALQSTAFLSDIAAMKHETLEPRIFRS